ncbi:alpha-tocopherol transfer protein-like isoform X2 [Stomoxys calcitrans]|uniref:alpha-tocopherol transfer protein-like isoform X2 n=1 Tax=Stomoxys calcitrans TaxID=35570 RepID=UPI0027E39799|nr:alpha-tocopherol transfer protein-like isoform X2 [Stomoxys calcitrans]
MLQIKPLSAELQKIAIEELHEVPARIPEDLKALKEWLITQPHLKARTDDQFLLQFLRGTKYSLEKAKSKLDYFFTFKTLRGEWYGITDVDDINFRQQQEQNLAVALPMPLHGVGPRIIFGKYADKYPPTVSFPYITATHEVLLTSDAYACICGTVYVIDFSNTNLANMGHFTVSFITTSIKFFIEAFPLRNKKLYAINIPKGILAFLKMFDKFIPEKYLKKIHLCGTDLTELEEYLPRKYLPVEYGGENGSLEQLCKDYNKVWDEYREYFKENAQYGTDERLRVGKKIELDGDLGINGSFRKLDVD